MEATFCRRCVCECVCVCVCRRRGLKGGWGGVGGWECGVGRVGMLSAVKAAAFSAPAGRHWHPDTVQAPGALPLQRCPFARLLVPGSGGPLTASSSAPPPNAPPLPARLLIRLQLHCRV